MKVAVLASLVLGASLAGGLETPSLPLVGQLSQTKQFELNLTWGSGAPDGIAREQFLVNGQFPGPPLIMDEGDNVEVTVNNFTPCNTTIHWHGIEQKGTPWADGVPGVSQRPILPGKRFVYNFTVEQYGTYWYHSHSHGQIMDGLCGPIYIRPRSVPQSLTSQITNETVGQAQIHKAIQSPTMVMLSDWFHMTSEELRGIAKSADIDPLCVDSILINGKGRVNCRDPKNLTTMAPGSLKPLLQGMEYTAKGCLSLENTYAQTLAPHNLSAVPSSLFDECNSTEAPEEVIEVNPLDGWASLAFTGSASMSVPTVSINNHSLWVYEVDGLYIKPVQVDALQIKNGGRYSCLVQLNKTPGNYTITAANSGVNQKIAGFGTLSYAHARPVISKPSINYGGVATNTHVVMFDETTIEMFAPSQPRQQADQTFILTAGRVGKAWKWALNGNHSYGLGVEAERPLLWDHESASKSPLTISTKNNTWVDLIFSLSGNISTSQPGHPLHKHSNPAYILGAGTGHFNWTSVAEAAKVIPKKFNLINPPLRDTFTTLPAFQGESWMAIRYHVCNPGAFLLHCHFDPHRTGGMGLVILDGVDAWPTIPTQYGPDGQWGSIEH